MNFEEILAAELPEPRDDEPESLRRDILDELADHLACSYRRELLSCADAESARTRAFERFGNPAAIAARLWFDAMKGRIMSQRILVAACVLMAVSCVALAGMTWFQSREIGKMQLAAAIVESHRTAAAEAIQNDMLKQLRTLTKAVEHPRSPDWNPASFKLTEETLDGPPAAGLNVSFGKTGPNHETISRVSDEKGIVDLDAVQPGGYSYSITRNTAKKFYSWWSTNGTVQVKPYQDLFKSIVCPPAGLRRFPIRLQHERPDDLTGRGLVLHVGFYGLSRKLHDGTTCSFSGLEEGQETPRPPQGMGAMGGGYFPPAPRLDFLIDLDGGTIERIRGVEPYYYSDGSIPRNVMRSQNATAPELIGHAHASFRRSDRTPISGDFKVLEGDHSLKLLSVLRLSGKLGSKDVDGYDVVALETFPGGMGGFGGGIGGGMVNSYQQRPDWMPKRLSDLYEAPLPFFAVTVPNSHITRNMTAAWSAEKDQVNTWTIKIPDELIAEARDALNAEDAAKAKKPEETLPAEVEAAKPKG